MTRSKLAADLALVQLLRKSLTRWLAAADFEADAADFDALPAPLSDVACGRWADEIARRHDATYKHLGLRLGILADSLEGKRVTATARKIPDLSGDRALLALVTAEFGVGTPPWWAAVTAVETIETLAVRVGLESLNAALAEKARDPVADALQVVEAIARFRAAEAARLARIRSLPSRTGGFPMASNDERGGGNV